MRKKFKKIFYIMGLCAFLSVPHILLSQTTYYSLTIQIMEGEGTTNPQPGTYYCEANTKIDITAIPASKYLFDKWVLNDGAYSETRIMYDA
ncbi:MAG: hypothetical protein NC824_01220, partial [Candidatus Omnitrophica bacterium]|nr:hypothetical protein [Candidatus Omnitrophota bacterium]